MQNVNEEKDPSSDAGQVSASRSGQALPAEVRESINRWMGTTNGILYFWENDGTYYVVQRLDLLYFLRLFRIGNEYVISQDHECEVS